jgi:hypothetical protein
MTELEYEARHSLTEHARSRTCSLGGVGTGNVVRAHGHTFIVTAKHVADTFYELKRPRVIFHRNYKIASQQLSYSCSTDDKLDIALIAVHDLNAEVSAYEYDDFEFIDDFHTYNFDGVNLQVFGFPEQLQQATKTDLLYFTISASWWTSDQRTAALLLILSATRIHIQWEGSLACECSERIRSRRSFTSDRGRRSLSLSTPLKWLEPVVY